MPGAGEEAPQPILDGIKIGEIRGLILWFLLDFTHGQQKLVVAVGFAGTI